MSSKMDITQYNSKRSVVTGGVSADTVVTGGRRCAPIPTAPDEDLLLSGVAVLTGGCDSLGLPLITFPTKNHIKLTSIDSSDLCELIKYFISLTKPSQRLNGFVFLADLRITPTMNFTVIIDALQKLQIENRGSVAVFYIIQPRAKESLKSLRKQLGIKQKKFHLKRFFRKSTSNEFKYDQNCLFKSIISTTQSELYRYFDRPQLTIEFGGSLTYSHEAWVHFRQEVEGLIVDIDKVFEKFPQAADKIELLKEYDVPDTEDDVNNLIAWIRNRYHDIMRELKIETVIDDCVATVAKCRNPDKHAIYCHLVKCKMFEDTSKILEKQHQRLVTARQQLLSLWQQAESRLMDVMTIKSLKLRAEKHLNWIEEIGLKNVSQSPEYATTLSQAEINKNHFETGFYAESKENLSEAEKLMSKMCENPDEKLIECVKLLQSKITEFRFQLEKRFQLYLDIYHFFLLSGKVTRWYKRTMSFLPLERLKQNVIDGTVKLTADWLQSVSQYLYKHPAPRPEHIHRIKDGINLIKDMKMRNQSRLLVYRVGLLRHLLVDKEITIADYQQLLQLKQQFKHGLDELDGSAGLSRSLPDISHITDTPLNTGRNIETMYSKPRVTINRDELPQRPHSAIPFTTSQPMIHFDSDSTENLPPIRYDSRRHAGESKLRKFRSQPDYIDSSTTVARKRASNKHTPGRRFVKARDQRTNNEPRKFSFHRSPIDRHSYAAIYTDSESSSSELNQERYISLSYPSTGIEGATAAVTAADGDIFFSNTLPHRPVAPSIDRDIHSMSLPNLARRMSSPSVTEDESQLSLTADNLELITTSHGLTPTQKLDLMNDILNVPATGRRSSLPRLQQQSFELTPHEKQIVDDIMNKQREEWSLQQQYLQEEQIRRQKIISLAQAQVALSDDSSRCSSRLQQYDETTSRSSSSTTTRSAPIMGTRSLTRNLHSSDEELTDHSVTPVFDQPLSNQRRHGDDEEEDDDDEDSLAYTIRKLAETSSSSSQQQQQSPAAAAAPGDDDTEEEEIVDTDRGYYDDDSEYEVMLNSDWVTRFDKTLPNIGNSSGGGGGGGDKKLMLSRETSDLGSENEVVADIKELEHLETALQKHAFLERHALIEQSRNRMLKDLVEMDMMTTGSGSVQ
ncbi:uncharacterized protein LOC141914593 isoform X2 [Tubulanus polymorphus]|uniref:uncharacterized protein LOC141914593 isoform X2 n=1 Tax=Tubulanus polymorphus TaxID=672921 RepID=UPI003DA1F339